MANIGMALAAIGAIFVASGGQTLPEEFSYCGKAEYQSSCGTCHGRDGKGKWATQCRTEGPAS